MGTDGFTGVPVSVVDWLGVVEGVAGVGVWAIFCFDVMVSITTLLLGITCTFSFSLLKLSVFSTDSGDVFFVTGG